MGRDKRTLKAQPVQRQTKKKGKRRGQAVWFQCSFSHRCSWKPRFCSAAPTFRKLLVNWLGKTDLATTPHPLLLRTAFPLPHPTLQLQRLSPSKETLLNASLFTRSSSVATEANELWLANLEKIERQTEASQVQLSAQLLIKSLRRCQRKVNWYNFFGCINKVVITFKNCKCVFIQGFHFEELILLAHLEKNT